MQGTRGELQGYEPFGMELTGRNYNSDSHRFGFNGQEKDNEVYGSEGTSYAFEYRMHDARVGRFWSIDPLAAKYPHNSPYAFSENRVIDGVELEGLEYATFNIVWNQKTGHVTSINVTTDYELKNEGSLGPGVRYNLVDEKTGNTLSWRLDKNMHGIYQGPDNPKLPKVGEGRYPVYDDYSLPPIDETDANAKQHDRDYDKDNLKGLGGVMDSKSSKANYDYIKRADETISKGETGGTDKITGKPVTTETMDAAKSGKSGFKAAEAVKGMRDAVREGARRGK